MTCSMASLTEAGHAGGIYGSPRSIKCVIQLQGSHALSEGAIYGSEGRIGQVVLLQHPAKTAQLTGRRHIRAH